MQSPFILPRSCDPRPGPIPILCTPESRRKEALPVRRGNSLRPTALVRSDSRSRAGLGGQIREKLRTSARASPKKLSSEIEKEMNFSQETAAAFGTGESLEKGKSLKFQAVDRLYNPLIEGSSPSGPTIPQKEQPLFFATLLTCLQALAIFSGTHFCAFTVPHKGRLGPPE